MRSFDASSTAAEVVPVNVLARLDDLIGDYLLVGARARDLITYCIAGLPLGRATLDVDISVAVRDHAELSELMSTLRTGRRKGVRFSVGSMPVDLLPYGDIASRGIVEQDEGVFLDPYEERCWEDGSAQDYDYDVFLVGSHLQGRDIARDFTEASVSRILPFLSDREQREQLVARMPPALAPRSDQLEALAAGIASRQC